MAHSKHLKPILKSLNSLPLHARKTSVKLRFLKLSPISQTTCLSTQATSTTLVKSPSLQASSRRLITKFFSLADSVSYTRTLLWSMCLTITTLERITLMETNEVSCLQIRLTELQCPTFPCLRPSWQLKKSRPILNSQSPLTRQVRLMSNLRVDSR